VELSDIIKELGYTATATYVRTLCNEVHSAILYMLSSCRPESIEELLDNLGVSGLSASHVAKILGRYIAYKVS